MPTTTTIKRNFLTVRQAAQRLKVAERTILRWIERGEIQAERIEPDRDRSDYIIALAEV